MKKILLSGMYGANNLGDDYILYSILSNIYHPEEFKITVISNGGTECQKIREFFPKVGICQLNGNKYRRTLKVAGEVMKTDIFMIGGGGLWPFESWKQLMQQKLYFAAADFCKVKIIFFGIEINPLKEDWSKKIWKQFISQAELCITRNQSTADQLLEIGSDAQKIHVFSDPTFGFQTISEAAVKDRRDNKEAAGTPYFLWVLAMPWTEKEMNQGHYQKRYAKLCRQISSICTALSERPCKHVFLPFYNNSDIIIIRDICKQLDETTGYQIIHEGDMPLEDKRLLFKAAKHVIAMRFHSVLFSLYYGVPFTAISYSNKTTSVLLENGLEERFVEFGIRASQFFGKEFDLDQQRLLELIRQEQNAESLSNLSNRSKQSRQSAESAFQLLNKWLRA